MIDENNVPVGGGRFTFAGYDSNASVLNPKITFFENIETDKDGKYKFSIIVPQNSIYVSYGPIGFVENGANNNLKTSLYNLFIEVDGKYEPYKKEVSPNIGQANTFNYQIKKR